MALFIPNFDLISYFVTVSAIGLVAFLLGLKYVKVLPKIVFPYLYCRLFKTFLENIVDQKRDIFAEMSEMKSADERLRSSGCIRILEIGAGPGSNFQFYPAGSKLTLLEPNLFFIDTLKSNQSKFPNCRLEKVIIGVGEDMSEIADDSFDAVVATYVLCSVTDIEKVLKEVHRVLAPGGKYFFLEHGFGRRVWWQRWLQAVVNPFWQLVGDGCQLTKNTLRDIEACKLFKNVSWKTFLPPSQASVFLGMLLGVNVYGSVQKQP